MERLRLLFAAALAAGALAAGERASASAASIKAIDFGDPANPEAGAPRAGSAGVAFLTIENKSGEALERLAYDLEPGACVKSIAPGFRVEALAAAQTLRMPLTFVIQFDRACAAGTQASFLMIGAYSRSGSAERVRDWNAFRFCVPRPGA